MHYGRYNLTSVTPIMHYLYNNFMNVIGNYSLIDDAKSDPHICLERGIYPVYHDAIHFAQSVISKIYIFWVGFDENRPCIGYEVSRKLVPINFVYDFSCTR